MKLDIKHYKISISFTKLKLNIKHIVQPLRIVVRLNNSTNQTDLIDSE